MHTNQGDVLLPLSTLKRTDAQSVLLNWTQSKVKQTDKQMSAEGGQATNSLPTMKHHKYKLFHCETQLLTKCNRNGTTNNNSPQLKTKGY